MSETIAIPLSILIGVFGTFCITLGCIRTFAAIGVAKCRHCGEKIRLGQDENYGTRYERRRDHEKVCLS